MNNPVATISKRIDQLAVAPPLTLYNLVPVVPDNSVVAHQTTLGDVMNLFQGNNIQLFKQNYQGSTLQQIGTNPIQLLPPPGPGKIYAIIPGTAAYRMNFLANVYTFGPTGIYLTSSISATTYGAQLSRSQINIGVSWADQFQNVVPNFVDNLDNQPLIMWAPDGNATQGDGTVTITFNYRIIDLT